MRMNRSDSGIRTGQASVHAPQRLEACGRTQNFSKPSYCGVSRMPIGPEYTLPYAWPPTLR